MVNGGPSAAPTRLMRRHGIRDYCTHERIYICTCIARVVAWLRGTELGGINASCTWGFIDCVLRFIMDGHQYWKHIPTVEMTPLYYACLQFRDAGGAR